MPGSVAALYDIHGNLPALEAVLREVRGADVERLVIGGDVLPGPMPAESLACLLDLDIPVTWIQGNGEVAVLAALAGAAPTGLPEQAREAARWTADQLAPGQRQVVAGWPMTVRCAVRGVGEVLFCHATPRNENDIFTRLTAAEPLLPLFAGLGVGLVVCGHTHMPFERSVGGVRVVNAGSVGMPFGEPGADWLRLGPGIELRHTAYDLEQAARRIRATGYPHADDFVERYVLHPPSEAEMLEVFGRAELGSSSRAADRTRSGTD